MPATRTAAVSSLTIALVISTAQLHPIDAQSPLLGKGHGIDHVGIAVRDLDSAGKKFARLGFQIDPGGKHPDGTANATVDFADDTYVELLSVYDRAKAMKGDASLVHFLEKHEGARFAGLDVSSADSTAGFLRRRGIEVAGPRRGTIAYPGIDEKTPGWWSVDVKSHVPGGEIFFLQYEPWKAFVARHPTLQPRVTHANGARRLLAAWMSVSHLALLRQISYGRG